MGRRSTVATGASGLAVVASLLVGASSTASAAGDVPGAFDITATAVGISVQSTQSPAASIVTAGLVDVTAPFTSSELSSYGTSESRGAPLYPGNLVAGGAALFCANVIPCPATPPEYPLLADAVHPTRPSAEAPADGTSPAGSASAHATATATDAQAAAGAVTPQAPAPLSVEGGGATTRAFVDGSGAHAVARSTLQGLTVGPLRIASLEATDAVDVTADGAVKDAPRLTVTGVTFNGSAASIDDTGVHVPGQDAGLPDRQLEQQGVSVRLVGTSRQDATGAGRSAAAALQLTLTAPVSGVPNVVPGLPTVNRTYLGTVLVGGAGAAVAASREAALELTPLPPLPPDSAAAAVLAPDSTTTATGDTGTVGLPAQLPGVVAAPAASGASAPQVAAPVAVRPVATWLPLPGLRAVALLLLVLPLALLVAWRGGLWLVRRRPTRTGTA